MEHTKWAYSMSRWPTGFDPDEAQQAMDLLGSDGWELVTSVATGDGDTSFFFKRPYTGSRDW